MVGKEWCQGGGQGVVPGWWARSSARVVGKEWCQGGGQGVMSGWWARSGARVGALTGMTVMGAEGGVGVGVGMVDK